MKSNSFTLGIIILALGLQIVSCSKKQIPVSEPTNQTTVEMDYDKLWQEIDSLDQKQLFRSAQKKVLVIHDFAHKNDASVQWIKSVIYLNKYAYHLSEDDMARVSGSSNVGDALLQLQSEDINIPQYAEQIDVIRVAQLNDMLNRFSTSMGMAERIKTTVFPPYYSSMIQFSILVFVLVYPVALSELVGYWSILYSSLLAMIFIKIFKVGQDLVDPFEGKPSDTPMSSIIRTIEINMLEQLGYKDTPPPVEPVENRYLM